MVSKESLPNFHFPTSKATLIGRQGLKESKGAKIYIHLFMKIYIKIIKLSNKLHLKEFIVIRGTHVTTNACFKTDEMIVTHRCMWHIPTWESRFILFYFILFFSEFNPRIQYWKECVNDKALVIFSDFLS